MIEEIGCKNSPTFNDSEAPHAGTTDACSDKIISSSENDNFSFISEESLKDIFNE